MTTCKSALCRLLVLTLLISFGLILACDKNEAGEGKQFREAPKAAGGSSWPEWRGKNRDAITDQTDWTPNWPRGGPKQVWKTNVGAGYSAVAIMDGRLYTMGNERNTDTVYCLDIADGKKLWTYSYNCRGGGHPGPRITPTIHGKVVYTLSYEGDIYCFDRVEGTVIWSRQLGREGYKPPTWGFAGSPLIEQNMVIVNVGHAGVAMNKDSGEIIWKTKRGVSGYASPVLFTYEGKKYLAMFSGKSLVIVQPNDGEIVCEFPWITAHNVNAVDPIVSGDKIFISSAYGNGACGVLKFDGDSLQQVWKNTSLKNHFNTCVLWKGHLYGFHGNVGRGKFKCLDFDTGEQKWEWGNYTGSCIIADEKIIGLTSNGQLFCGPVSSQDFNAVSEARVLGGRTWNMPTLLDGRIYVRNHVGDLICLDVSK